MTNNERYQDRQQMVNGNKDGLRAMHSAYLKGQDLKSVYLDIVKVNWFRFDVYGYGKVQGAREYLQEWLADNDLEEYFTIRLRLWDQWLEHVGGRELPIED